MAAFLVSLLSCGTFRARETAAPTAADRQWSWVVLGPEGVAIARTVVTKSAEGHQKVCPEIEINGKATAMEVRGSETEEYPILVCEHKLDRDTKSAKIRGHELPLPKAEPKRIVVIGDTGCRVKKGSGFQDCNNKNLKSDTDGWPLKQIADAAAQAKPDLVIHVGDYIYSKSPCSDAPPDKRAGCEGRSYGQNWQTLEKEIFEPAAELMQAAPWVVPRGNHENCGKKVGAGSGGQGFFLLLDPRPYDTVKECKDTTDPYVVPAGARDLWVLDSNFPLDTEKNVKPELVEKYQGQFKELAGTLAKGRHAWLLTHRPLYAVYPGKRGGGAGVEAEEQEEKEERSGKKSEGGNKEETGMGKTSAQGEEIKSINVTLQKALEEQIPAGLGLVISGHMHLFQKVSFPSGERPFQFVVGNGATALDLYYPPSLDHFTKMRLAGKTEETTVDGVTIKKFGFLELDQVANSHWKATLKGKDGETLLSCELNESDRICESK
jgi:hypothetical protein